MRQKIIYFLIDSSVIRSRQFYVDTKQIHTTMQATCCHSRIIFSMLDTGNQAVSGASNVLPVYHRISVSGISNVLPVYYRLPVSGLSHSLYQELAACCQFSIVSLYQVLAKYCQFQTLCIRKLATYCQLRPNSNTTQFIYGIRCTVQAQQTCEEDEMMQEGWEMGVVQKG